MPQSELNHLDVLNHWSEWCNLSKLIDYGINYIGDGWHEGEFGKAGKWAYVTKSQTHNTYLLVFWSFDPRPFLKKVADAEVRTP